MVLPIWQHMPRFDINISPYFWLAYSSQNAAVKALKDLPDDPKADQQIARDLQWVIQKIEEEIKEDKEVKEDKERGVNQPASSQPVYTFYDLGCLDGRRSNRIVAGFKDAKAKEPRVNIGRILLVDKSQVMVEKALERTYPVPVQGLCQLVEHLDLSKTGRPNEPKILFLGGNTINNGRNPHAMLGVLHDVMEAGDVAAIEFKFLSQFKGYPRDKPRDFVVEYLRWLGFTKSHTEENRRSTICAKNHFRREYVVTLSKPFDIPSNHPLQQHHPSFKSGQTLPKGTTILIGYNQPWHEFWWGYDFSRIGLQGRLITPLNNDDCILYLTRKD